MRAGWCSLHSDLSDEFPHCKDRAGLMLLHPRFTLLKLLVCVQEVRRINMNAQGDDHVSFSAAHLALQGQYLLVSTDGPRIIMYNITGESLGTLQAAVSRITWLPLRRHAFCLSHREECIGCAFLERQHLSCLSELCLQLRLAAEAELLRPACGEVSSAAGALAPVRPLCYCSSGSWLCVCLPCR